MAGISIEDGRTLVVQPWDASILRDIEKALQLADLGTNPVNEGARIRIVLPPMTEERRQHLCSRVRELAEEARISVRQQRQEVHSNAKKDESRTEDEHRDFEEALQKEVDTINKEIEELAEKKEEDIMKV